jgi:hypothetical protein
VGTIHNMPTAGSSVSCSTYLGYYGWSLANAAAQILTPSVSGVSAQRFVLENFLYCNHSPQQDLGGSSSCTWSGGLNWGSAAVDAVNWHMYWSSVQPEAIIPSLNNLISDMNAQGDGCAPTPCVPAKPIVDSESSAGNEAGIGIWHDDYSIVGGVLREFALYYSNHVDSIYHYAYNVAQDSNLIDNNTLAITVMGTAWLQMYSWLNGATPANSAFCSAAGTVYTCPMTMAGGQLAQLTWDSKFGPGGSTAPANCANAANPIVCGTTSYTVPSAYTGNWISADGVSHTHGSAVTIGAVPVLFVQAPATSGGATIKGPAALKGPTKRQ